MIPDTKPYVNLPTVMAKNSSIIESKQAKIPTILNTMKVYFLLNFMNLLANDVPRVNPMGRIFLKTNCNAF